MSVLSFCLIDKSMHLKLLQFYNYFNFVSYVSVKSLEKAKSTGQFAVTGSMNSHGATLSFDVSGSDSEESHGQIPVAKKIKLSVE